MLFANFVFYVWSGRANIMITWDEVNMWLTLYFLHTFQCYREGSSLRACHEETLQSLSNMHWRLSPTKPRYMRRVLGTFGGRSWIKMLSRDNINYKTRLTLPRCQVWNIVHSIIRTSYKASSCDLTGFLAKEILQSQTQIQTIRATYYARMF